MSDSLAASASKELAVRLSAPQGNAMFPAAGPVWPVAWRLRPDVSSDSDTLLSFSTALTGIWISQERHGVGFLPTRM